MPDAPSFIDRGLSQIRRLWRDLSGETPADAFDSELKKPEDQDALRARFSECLAAKGGQVSARGRAAALGDYYLRLSPPGRRRFLDLLARHFDIDRFRLHNLAAAYADAMDPHDARAQEAALRDALVAPWLTLLTQFNALPQGVRFLVGLRADLLSFRDQDDDPGLSALDDDLKRLLASWFDVGFLDLKRIDWSSPAALLEKLIAYEAVHKIKSWTDLRNRLDSDRRCYAFFHPRMPDEPLIFVEVALVTGVAGQVQALLDETAPIGDPRQADTAIFYSISNTQAGLRGVGFGDFLIKKVVDDLSRDFPNLRTFATLSPIPGFRRWFDKADLAELETLIGAARLAPLQAAAGERGWRAALQDPDWRAADALVDAAQAPLLTLGAHYLTEVKARDGKPLDPVARFHLGNGAAVERLNWLGDLSPKGHKESLGLMVNYRYRLENIEAQHEAFVGQGVVAASDAVLQYLAPPKSKAKDSALPRLFSGKRSKSP